MSLGVSWREVALGRGVALTSDGATRVAGKATISGLGWRVWGIIHYGVGCLGKDRV